ncbi:MAG: hypothetical protein ACPGLV_01960 [Bacteroidia bacterium]
MKKLVFVLLPFVLFISCQDETDNGGSLNFRDYVKADTFFPLTLNNTWEYKVEDSTGSGIKTSYRNEVVDSCCYYIGVYDKNTTQYLGWKWRDYSWESMYSNGGGLLFNTIYINEKKGQWHRIDSLVSQNTVLVDIASGLYQIETEFGRYNCIKTKTKVKSPDGSFNVVHTRYFAKGIGLLKHTQKFWEDPGTNRAYLYKTVTYTLVNAAIEQP